MSPDLRRAARQARSIPLICDLETWLRAPAGRLPRKSDMGGAIAHLLKRWDGLAIFAGDGRVELTAAASKARSGR